MQISSDYIRGLVDGEGCFTFCTIPTKNFNGNRIKLPTFVIQMHERDKDLLEKTKDFLGIKNKVYILNPSKTDSNTRGKSARLMVREFGLLRDTIIPFFYEKLIGYKREQFINWLEKIGNDPDVHRDFKVLHKLYVNGYFKDKQPILKRFT